MKNTQLWVLGSGAILLAGAILAAMQFDRRPPRAAAEPRNASGLQSSLEPELLQPIDRTRIGDSSGTTGSAELTPKTLEHVDLLKGIDLEGRLQRPGTTHDCQAVVITFLGTQCPISNSVLPRLNRLAQEFASQGVEFFGVISSRSVSRVEALKHSQEFGVSFPVLMDPRGELRSRFEATHSPHAFVLSPRGETLYSGLFDDQFPSVTRRRTQPIRSFVREAIKDVLDGHSVQTPETEPVGCLLEPLSSAGQSGDVTFARDIAPIVYANCTKCHREAAVAPFPLTTYDEVKRHAAQIRLMVELRLMPPWKPAHGYARFRDEMVLTDHEIELVNRWVDDGTPLGDQTELPEPPEFADGWQLGEPDLIIDVPESDVPADGPDIYQYFVIPTGLTQDRLVRAIEYSSENPQLVHHASFRYDDAGEARKLDEDDPRPGYRCFGGWGFESGGTLGGWAVGILPQPQPAGFGRPMPAGCDFVVQTHYHPNGRAATDRSRVGIYFASDSARRRIGELSVAKTDLHIPPGSRGFRHMSTYTLPTDTIIHRVLPHTHLLGRKTSAVAILPDGRTEPLIRIDDWDFNWQSSYQYAQPLQLPAGTRIEFEVVFDNSVNNPMNPHTRPRWVHWGESSLDEMAVCFFDVSTPDDADLDALIQHNREYIYAQRSAQSDRGTP